MRLSANGRTADLTVSQLTSDVQFKQKFENAQFLNFGSGAVRVVRVVEEKDPKNPASLTTVSVFVTFVGNNYVLTDVPDVTIDTSNLTFKAGANVANAFTVRNVPALVNPNNDGVITANEINPAALQVNIDPSSASFTDVNGNVAPRSVYVNGRTGTYEPNAPLVNNKREIFNEIGGFGGTRTIPQFASDSTLDVDLTKSFEAYSIKLRAVAPTTAGSPIELTADAPDNTGRELLLYGIDYDQEPFKSINPNTLIRFTTAATVQGTVSAGNVFLAVNDSGTVNEDGSVTLNVVSNDTDPTNGAITLDSIVTQPANGTVQIVNNQAVYTPNGNYFGSDSFVYRAKNSANATSDATVSITVSPVNDPPTAGTGKTLTTAQDTPGSITTASLLTGATAGPANETGQTLSVISAGPNSAQGGTVSLNGANNTVVYTPKAGFSGSDSFTYVISDGQAANNTVTGTVNVTVTPGVAVNAVDDSFPVNQGTTTTLNVLQNDAGSNIEITSVTNPGQGSVTIASDKKSISYTAPANFAGTTTFSYTITGGAQTDTATVTLTVNAVNQAPNAVDDQASVDSNSGANVLNVLQNDTDAEGAVTITAVTQPANGGSVAISGNGQNVTFTPTAGFVGSSTFTYTITDAGNLTDTATVTVQVVAPIRPRAVNDSYSVNEDNNLTLNIASQLLNNDLPNAGQTVVLAQLLPSSLVGQGTLVINDQGTTATADDTVTYQPPQDFNGTVTFTYRISDTGGVVTDQAAATGTVTITVNPVNDAPTAANDTVGPTNEDIALDINTSTLLANDSRGPANESSQTLTVTGVSAASAQGGTVTLANNVVRYTPKADFNGQDTFTYTISDGQATNGTATGTVTINVTAVNDAPVAGALTRSTNEDTALTIPVGDVTAVGRPGPATATDENGQTLTITGVTTPSAQGGTVQLVGNNIVYTPAKDFFSTANLTETFTYTLSDGVATSTGTVTVTVNSVNDDPTAGADTASGFQNQTLTITAANLLANDSAGPANEGQTLTITAVRPISGVTQGTVSLVNGNVQYIPPTNVSGISDRFEYVISDGVTTAVGQVTVNVLAFQPSTFTGAIIIDGNQNGVRETSLGERGLGGVEIRLTGTSIQGAVSRTTLTDINGNFSFGNLAPGTYSVAYSDLDGVAEGDIFAGANVTETSNLSFSFTIANSGGATLSNNMFTAISLDPNRSQILDLLVSSYVANNPSVNPVANSGGLTIMVDSSGDLEYYRSEGGYSNVQRITADIDATQKTVQLTVLTTDGRILQADVAREKALFIKAADGTNVVRVFGGLDSHTFVQIGSSGQANFASQVDSFFGSF